METAVVNGNGTETGHIIVTTIGGKNGQAKQVRRDFHVYMQVFFSNVMLSFLNHISRVFRQ